MRFKPFSQEMHDKCDIPTRNKVKEYLKNVWCVDAIANPDKYGVDLVCFKNFEWHCFVEVEQRIWREGLHQCPYNTIHVAYRKKKLFNNDLPTYLFAVNYLHELAYWINADEIMSSPLIEVKNKAVANDEYFYDVPTSKWRCINLNDLF